MTLARLIAMRGHMCQSKPIEPVPTRAELLTVFLMAEDHAREAMGQEVHVRTLLLGNDLMREEIREAEAR
jgi:hypothetical protein